MARPAILRSGNSVGVGPAALGSVPAHGRGRTRVLFVNAATRPPLGADVWVHAQLMRELDRSRFDLHTACTLRSDGGPTPTYEELRSIPDLCVHPVNFGSESFGSTARSWARLLLSAGSALWSVARLIRFIRSNDVAIIHAPDRPRDALVSIVLSRVTGAKSVVHVHVGYGDWMSRVRRWTIKEADAVITVSDFVKQTLVDAGHDGRKIYPVLNGIDVDRWSEQRRTCSPGDVRRELGIPMEAATVITVCRLFPSKGPGDLIRALSELVEEAPEARLVIVGAEMQSGYRAELERLSESLGIGARVIFTGWRSDVPRLMSAADIFAMPSIGEPLGLVYLEAMAMGLPVVALASGGVPEVVDPGVTGLLSEVGDLEGLAANLRALLRSRELRDSMGSRGRERVQQHFNSGRMARDLEVAYERIGL